MLSSEPDLPKPRRFPKVTVRGGAAVVAVILFVLFGFNIVVLDESNPNVSRTAAIALVMNISWIFDLLPLAVTSLFPVFLFPMLGVVSGKAIATTYFSYVTFVFLGGFIVAIAMQKWNLHNRVALKVVIACSGNKGLLLFGMMVVTWFLSMWISNTATIMAMLPNILAVASRYEAAYGVENTKKLSIAMLLGCAYASSIGGIGTLIGTPPNLSFANFFSQDYPGASSVVTFASWFQFAFPVSAVFFLIVYAYFYFFYIRKEERAIQAAFAAACSSEKDPQLEVTSPSVALRSASVTGRPPRAPKSVLHAVELEEGRAQPGAPAQMATLDISDLRDQYAALGPMSFEEKAVTYIFVVLALLWLFRADLAIGSVTIPGWAGIFPIGAYIDDGSVAMLIAVVLFLFPAKNPSPDELAREEEKARLAELEDLAATARLLTAPPPALPASPNPNFGAELANASPVVVHGTGSVTGASAASPRLTRTPSRAHRSASLAASMASADSVASLASLAAAVAGIDEAAEAAEAEAAGEPRSRPAAKTPGKRVRMRTLISWPDMKAIPWDLVLLFGGGFALASGFSSSGLSSWLGDKLQAVISGMGLFWITLVVAVFTTFMTELTSNSATANVLLPILSGVAQAADMNPLALMLPGTLACSFAFMLPVATPPNTIAFSSKKFSVKEMVIAGAPVSIAGMLVATISVFFWSPVVFDYDPYVLPVSWTASD
jgi:di/tricarboxylate transporter